MANLFHEKPQQEKSKLWFGAELYKEGQPWDTFVKDSANHDFVAEQISSLVSNPRQSIALEIGPGNRPVLLRLPFRRMFFMDRSKAIAHGLKRTRIPVRVTKENLGKFKGKVRRSTLRFYQLAAAHPERAKAWVDTPFRKLTGRRATVLTGDIPDLPFSSDQKLDLVVVNEVLTHIKPSQRVAVVEELARRAKSLLLIDRPQVPVEQLRAEWKSRHRLNLAFKRVWSNESQPEIRAALKRSARWASASPYFTRQ